LEGALEDAAGAKVRRVRLGELVEDVRASRIANNVNYKISESAA
jgi:hypothetical protein